jgi:PIN domain nuclease of toxin-antitoxin system
MIVLDTHIWIWWVHGDPRLSGSQEQIIGSNESVGIGVSAISCWEIAKLIEGERIALPLKVEDWFAFALGYPGVSLVELSPEIAIASTRLKGFHRDPADQIIAATANTLGCPLVTSDTKLLDYPHVETIP